MISLAGRDILHAWGRFLLTGLGLGLLIGVTLTMAGVYRGMVDDARALLGNSVADLWVVQQNTQGPCAESSSLQGDVVHGLRGRPGVARAARVSYLTMQVRRGLVETRAMVGGFEREPAGLPGAPGYLIAGRHITRNHYEAVVDERLRVRGVSGVRVVDTSILPFLVAGNTAAPAMAMAWRAADLILADANLPTGIPATA